MRGLGLATLGASTQRFLGTVLAPTLSFSSASPAKSMRPVHSMRPAKSRGGKAPHRALMRGKVS